MIQKSGWATGLFLFVFFLICLSSANGEKNFSKETLTYEERENAYRAALGCFFSEQYEEAESAFRKIIEKEPENAKALIYLADTLHARGKTSEAHKNYLRAAEELKAKHRRRKELLPELKDPGIVSDIVYCLNAVGDYKEAQQFGMMGFLEGDAPDLFINTAYSFYKMNQMEVAEENFCQAGKVSRIAEYNNLTFRRISRLFENGREWIFCPEQQQEIEKGVNYALIISIGAYRDSLISPLQYAVDDARELYEVLTDPRTGLFEPENIVYLTNQNATRQEIEFKFDDLIARAKNEQDLLFVFYAGHGFTYPNTSDTYWLTYDTLVGNDQGMRIKSTALSNLTLAKKLSEIKAHTVVLFVDACFSAGMVDQSSEIRGLETYLSSGKDYVIISSSQANQMSIESNRLKHGLFSYYLIHGLRGDADMNMDGWVEVEEIWPFIKNQVSSTAKQMGSEQDPRRSGSSGRSIFLSKNPNL